MFQIINLISHLTIIENVELLMIPLSKPPMFRRRRVLEILSKFLRVAIARELVKNPEIILTDEPTGNLDLKNAHQVAKILREIGEEERTVVMVTHNMEPTKPRD